jgi:acetoin utilization deacetylase AcuC-like enzyme
VRRTAVYKHPLFLAHDTGRNHLESADRIRGVYQELERPEGAAHLLFPSFVKASLTSIRLNHGPELVREVAATAHHIAAFLDPDTRTSAISFEAALMASGAVIDGIRSMQRGEIDNAFCLVRPPGHHAEQNRAMGFCLFNNIAVAAKWAIRHLGLKRILIVDWDVHHGNGTQKSWYRSDKVLYCSVHQSPLYPGTGALSESGEGCGQGYTVNIPLRPGHGDEGYARICNEIFVPLCRAYRPQLILVSCGFDVMAGDPIGLQRVSPAGIAYMTRVLVDLATELCQGKILLTLEGGYSLDNMHSGVLAVLSELFGGPLAVDHPVWLSACDLQRFHTATVESADIDQAVLSARNHWTL